MKTVGQVLAKYWGRCQQLRVVAAADSGDGERCPRGDNNDADENENGKENPPPPFPERREDVLCRANRRNESAYPALSVCLRHGARP